MNQPNKRSSRRPPTGWEAWQLTIAYISNYHSPDAILKLQVTPQSDGSLCWSSSLTWGQHDEKVNCQNSLAQALSQLWQQVDRFHYIFENPEDAVRSPIDYDDLDWLDMDTQEVLHRLIWMTKMSFKHDWSLILVYEPTEDVATRVKMRILALENVVQVGGTGNSLKSATHSVFRNAGTAYIKYANIHARKPPSAD